MYISWVNILGICLIDDFSVFIRVFFGGRVSAASIKNYTSSYNQPFETQVLNFGN